MSSGWRLLFGFAIAIGVAAAGEARAGQVLDFSSATNAGVLFNGNGSSATFSFYNNINNSSQGFQVTQTNGYNGAVGLFGTINGSFTYGSPITSTPTPAGTVQSAAVSGTGGGFTINDGSNVFSTTLTAVSLYTLGTAGNFDVQLTSAVYTGSNTSLIALRNVINSNPKGAQAAISFSFVPGETLTDLLNATNQKTGYSGTLSPLSVPEPSSLALAGTATAAMVGYTLRRRRTGRRL